jgi:hypothetical protein
MIDDPASHRITPFIRDHFDPIPKTPSDYDLESNPGGEGEAELGGGRLDVLCPLLPGKPRCPGLPRAGKAGCARGDPSLTTHAGSPKAYLRRG